MSDDTDTAPLIEGRLFASIDDSPALTAEVVAAYASKVALSADGLQDLIVRTHATFRSLSEAPPSDSAAAAPEELPQTPEAIAASITPDALISFLDGKSYKTLKRHLTSHGMDEASYRTRFGLASDYPMVAPNYSAQRSALAKATGLGRPAAADTGMAA